MQHGDRRRVGAPAERDSGTRHSELNWDPGNAAHRDEIPYPDGYARLPKGRIGHVHCKDAVKGADGKTWEWAAMGRGVIDWAGQFRALKQDGYRRAVTLETHWKGGGTPEESSRQSFAGMKALLQKAGAASGEGLRAKGLWRDGDETGDCRGGGDGHGGPSGGRSAGSGFRDPA